MRRTLAVPLVLALVLAPAGGGAAQASASSPGPPVLFFTIDTLRHDQLGRRDGGRDATPFLDSLAASGFDFERCWAQCSWTLPSMLSLFSSLEPPTIGVRVGFDVHDAGDAPELEREVFAERHVTLTEVLRDAGWATHGITTNALLTGVQGFPQGFESFDESCLWGSADCALDLAADAILARGHDPLFLWVHLFDPHAVASRRDPRALLESDGGEDGRRGLRQTIPTYPPPPGTEELFGGPLPALADSVRRDYARRVRFMDDRLGEFFAREDLRAFLDAALIVVAVDHGEEFFEKGKWSHGLSVAETLVHTPLVIRLPAGSGRGGRVDTPVRNLDVAPTILDLVGVETPASFQGVSLRPLLEGGRLDVGYVYGETYLGRRDLHFLIDPSTLEKLVLNLKRGTAKLYALDEDPAETRDLTARRPEAARRLEAELRERMAVLEAAASAESRRDQVDPELLEKLEAFGYIGN